MAFLLTLFLLVFVGLVACCVSDSVHRWSDRNAKKRVGELEIENDALSERCGRAEAAAHDSHHALQSETNAMAAQAVKNTRELRSVNMELAKLKQQFGSEVRGYQKEIVNLQQSRDNITDKLIQVNQAYQELYRRADLASAALQGKAREVAAEGGPCVAGEPCMVGAPGGACVAGGPCLAGGNSASPPAADSLRPTSADMQYANQCSPKQANPNPRNPEAEASARGQEAAGLPMEPTPFYEGLRAYAGMKARTFAATDAGAARLGRPSLAELLTVNLQAAGLMEEFMAGHRVW